MEYNCVLFCFLVHVVDKSGTSVSQRVFFFYQLVALDSYLHSALQDLRRQTEILFD